MPLHVSSTCAHHQEAKIALHSLWYHHTYRWPSGAQVERDVHETATYRCDDTRGCVMQFWPPDDEHMCSKHLEAWNKLIVKQKFCASSWLTTDINILSCTVSKMSNFLFIWTVVVFVRKGKYQKIRWHASKGNYGWTLEYYTDNLVGKSNHIAGTVLYCTVVYCTVHAISCFRYGGSTPRRTLPIYTASLTTGRNIQDKKYTEFWFNKFISSNQLE